MISSRRFNAVSKSGAGVDSVPSAIRGILTDFLSVGPTVLLRAVYSERRMRILLLLVAAASLLAAGCASDLEPAVDHATVVAPHASVRLKSSSTSRTVRVLEPGDKI